MTPTQQRDELRRMRVKIQTLERELAAANIEIKRLKAIESAVNGK
jgi:hypothetical protein